MHGSNKKPKKHGKKQLQPERTDAQAKPFNQKNKNKKEKQGKGEKKWRFGDVKCIFYIYHIV